MSISLKLATLNELKIVVDIDELKRKTLLEKSIAKNECFLVLKGAKVFGFIVFNYSFFGCGWLDMIEINKEQRGKGIGEQVISHIINVCKAEKLFTSTNESNVPMRNLLAKMGFIFSGVLKGLDDDDPEMFFYKKL